MIMGIDKRRVHTGSTLKIDGNPFPRGDKLFSRNPDSTGSRLPVRADHYPIGYRILHLNIIGKINAFLPFLLWYTYYTL
jgi:hypothetical protein